MTERLSALLHAEADHLAVPPPPAAEALAAAHRARRRRTSGRLAVGGAVLLVAATAVVAATLGGDRPGGPSRGDVVDPAADAPADVGAVFAVDDTVWLHDGAVSATVAETVQAIYPTSAGVLLRTNRDGSSDGGAPFHFSLVAPDGTVSDLGLTLGEVVPATDPTEPYLAYADVQDDAVQTVVVDVTTGAEVARVDVPGTFTWGGWEAPPVALAGDTVYVATDDATQLVDWRTGSTERSAVLPGGSVPDVSGGHVITTQGRTLTVRDAQTGADLLSVAGAKLSYMTLSPDGRYAKVVDQLQGSGFDVYSVATGAHVSFDAQSWDFGWTPTGGLFGIDADGLDRCDPDTGACTTSPVPDGFQLDRNTLVRVLGMTYES